MLITRTAKDFSRKEIFRIAQAYSTGRYSYIDFYNEYGCSPSTFYKILECAVTKCIVSDEIAEKIGITAVSNSRSKLEDTCPDDSDLPRQAANRGRASNKSRFLKRADYVLTRSEAIDAIDDYVSSPDSMEKFCEKYFITPKAFSRTIRTAILSGWIPLKRVENLRQKAYQFNASKPVDRTFDVLIRERKKRQKAAKSKQ